MKINFLRLFFWSGLVLCLILITTCKELEKTMLVATDEATNVLTNSADLPGQIIDLGGGATQHGHYYGKSDNPNAGHTTLGAPTSVSGFTSQVTGLEAGTKYFFKAYMTDGQETVYGKEKSFTTVAASAPTLTTTAVTSITLTGAVSGGNITSDGGSPVTARGVCWNNFTAPTTSNNKTTDATGIGTFISTLTGLTAGSTYFVRAYATNSAGTTYGNELTFTTTAASTPTVSTNSIAGITFNSGIGGGNVVSDGGSPVLQKGVCWSTSTGPTISNTRTTDGTGTGSYASDISGLNPATKYYVRAYATNLIGTAYGSEVSFTTADAPIQLPVITTVSPGNITSISATSGGNITSDGGSTITQRGVCWNGTGSATLGENQTVDGSGSGSFPSTLTGLASNTKYYVRAYAVNGVGTAYGNEYSFTTLSPSSAVITTSAITSIAQTTATGGGNITSDGGSSITSRGVCWSLNQNPTLADSYTTNDFGTGIFNSQLTNLSPGKTYYVRAYATNSTGTTYGNQVSFLTASDIPKVTTSAVGTLTSTTAAVGGEVLDNNGSTVTTRGICYNLVGSPTVSDNIKSESGSIGTFTMSLTGLTPNTNYYFRAFATNGVGTAYGAQGGFVTLADIPTLTTNAITAVTTTTATSGGVITSDNGNTVLVKGVCWSTTTGPVIGGTNQTNDGGSSTPYTSAITGLLPNTKYYVRAYATNSKGTGYGDEKNFTTNSIAVTAPGAPTIGLATKGNAQATVAFTAPASDGGSAITGYTATANPGGLTGTGTASPITVTGLTNGTAYTFTVTATNGIGTGPSSSASNSVTPSTVPGAPVIGTATAGNAKATITFTAPDDGGTFITGYTVTSNPGGITGTGGSSPIDVTGLANIAYTFTVTATNANGTGAASAPSNSVTPTLIPGAPTIGTATAGDSYASVAFTPPVSDGGSPITVYIVTSNPGGKQGTGVVSPVNVTGLTNGTSYTFTVTATNINGTSPVSAASNTVTPAAVPTLTTISISSITSTTATSGGNITSNGGATVTASGVCWGTASGPIATGNHTTDGAVSGTYASTITGLTLGQTYYVRAYATNSAGTGYGSEVSFTTALAIGDNYQGGVVAYILQSGDPGYVAGQTRGLIAAPSDQSLNAPWGCVGTLIAGADGSAIGTGNQNTTDIVVGCSTASIAAQICNDLVLGGYIDWYLPSKDELNKLFQNKVAVGGFSTGTYWSSTESSGNYAWSQSFATGFYDDLIAKNFGNYVRAIRAFPAAPALPAVSTTAASAITSTTATSGGNVLADGGATVTARGVCWGTTTGPTILSSKTTDGSGTGVFASSLTGLTPNTTYYLRAYATNSAGTNYGNEVSFSTPIILPTVTTTATTGVLLTSATMNGIVNANNSNTTVLFQYGTTTSYGSFGTGAPYDVSGTTTTAVTSFQNTLSPNTTYHFRITATNSAGTSYGGDMTFTTAPSTITDIEGNTYNVIAIGNQIWIKENLKVKKYTDGNTISGVFAYNFNEANVAVYGRLYVNTVFMTSNKLCPTGWHVPSSDEFTTLTDFLGGASVAGGKMKEAGTSHWVAPNTGADNTSNFTGLPGGDYMVGENFSGLTGLGFWGTKNGYILLNSSSAGVSFSSGMLDGYCFSIRCIKD